MADSQQSPNSNIVFKGTDGNECETFVIAIRDLAFANGKQEDCNWMLHYATTRLRGKALRWHAKLDPSVRKDWDLFVQALFEEYPLVRESGEDGIETPFWSSTSLSVIAPINGSPSNRDPQNFAPSSPQTSDNVAHTMVARDHEPQLLGKSALQPFPRVYDPSFPGLHTGRLRVLFERGSTDPLYIWWGPPHVEKCKAKAVGSPELEVLDWKSITTNIHEALIVSFVASAEPHPHHQIIGTSELLKPRTIEAKANPLGYLYQTVSTIWNILEDGTLQATLADTVKDRRESRKQVLRDNSASYSTTTVNVSICGGSISFVKDPSVPGNPSTRARVVFEPL